ncbi:aminoacyl-tRNA hydrolase [Bacillus canaveralius]|uniref:Peptidyl-tRNA hydrolase n=1 Tax=Bacillus canaveralius TaxID=1403243 RepID=A0A2N5GHK4_9BACI|nr:MULTISPECIES: aminoacyl-tRNA hydrolase [Bacillus]PLR80282.1 aminoacyl-tRNA hydrolase [Bacillus canaveralius]PLR83255.1 aminoacyl-tRNA hydrolase [Bacillus sp. V33-4]PLS00507.1 aminoacyl-tRNA hydrolase [Bacillus canaveralius]RSK56892.1 aminoacyl-tRNA hydrolase [Bacillus canaveralius]
MKIIAGLGNPGKQYEQTRHNIGFAIIDLLSARLNIPVDQSKFKGIYGIGHVNGQKVILLKPLTYMNLSGESIRAVLDYYDAGLDDLLIIYDDLDLPVGKIRLRQKGSAGGHNGLKSTIAHLGSQEFKRIRVGVGRPPHGMNVPDYVLGRFLKEEQEVIDEVAGQCADACEAWLQKPFLQVMNDFNQ